MSGIFDVIRIPFGFIIKWLYSFTNSYLIAILLFSVLLKLVMFPFGIKQQKNSQKQAKLRPKENVIRKKYAGRTDRATQLKMNTEIQELYQKENFSPLGGCLPMFVSMMVLLAVYAVVRAPLTYTAKLPTVEDFGTTQVVDSVKRTVAYMAYQDDLALEEGETRQINRFLNIRSKDYSSSDFWKAFEGGSFTLYAEINSISYIRDHEAEFVKAFDAAKHLNASGEYVTAGNGAVSGQMILDALPKMEVFDGFDLGRIPSIDDFKAEKIGTKCLLIVPLLTLITAYFGQSLTRKFTYQPEQSAEVQSQMRMMNIFMPLFSLYIAFQVPSAVGIYWMMSNVLSPVQQIALSKLYPIKEISPEEMREAERLYGGKQKKKKGNTATGKKKSLVYDDDDEYESVTTAPEKKVLAEKKDANQASVVEKAPLKDE